nr:odorant binding protein 17 [Megachile saussurei]
MKGVYVAVGVLLVAATIRAEDYIASYLELMKDPILTCAKENGFTEQDARVIFDKDVSAGEDQATCLRACTMKMGAFMQHSKLNMRNIKAFIGVVHAENPDMLEKLEKAATECADKVKDISDECKMAYVYIQCFLDKH